MKNILGIGTAGSRIAEQLSEFKNYQTYQISNEFKRTTKYKFALPLHSGPEEYENLKMDKLHKWLDKIENSCTIFLCGASDSSAITLRALEPLSKKGIKMDIVYFTPEVEVLSEIKTLHERSVRGILQNFTRSGLFNKICMISNIELERLAGPTNVIDYYKQINHVFTSTYYMMDVFKNTRSITSTFKKQKDSCRITTIGLGSLSDEDKLLFPFKREVDVVYYCGINEEKLKTEENLFRTITNKSIYTVNEFWLCLRATCINSK